MPLHPAFPRGPRLALLPLVWLPAALAAQAQGDPAEERYSAEIRRTSWGVPHGTAADLGNLGFGVGYAFAEDNLCELADMILTVDGRRSLHHGATTQNVATDLFFTRIIDAGEIEATLSSADAPSAQARALAAEYAAGVSLCLRRTGVENV